MNYIKISKHDIANGPGIRVVLWCSGCSLKCEGCHNPESQKFDAGRPFTNDTMNELRKALNSPYVRGITLSGGHPLEYANLPDVFSVCKMVRDEFPTKDIWLYTGYTLNSHDFDNTVDIGWDNALLMNHILAMCDVVVDGSFIQSKKDVSLKFRGSSNQRLIDVRKTVDNKRIIVIDDNDI